MRTHHATGKGAEGNGMNIASELEDCEIKTEQAKERNRKSRRMRRKVKGAL